MRNRGGYTLIEMLTVIGIIAVLTGIIFPVYSTVKTRARMSACMSNLHSISVGLNLYFQSQKCYPDHLLYQAADGTMTGLYPGYIKDLALFTCPVSGLNSSSPVVDVEFTPYRGSLQKVKIYSMSTYDVAQVSGAMEKRYDLYRGILSTSTDFSRQLMFTDAPKDTVVTWCSYHRTSPEYLPDPKKEDLVLWLDGRVEKRPAADYNVQCVVK